MARAVQTHRQKVREEDEGFRAASSAYVKALKRNPDKALIGYRRDSKVELASLFNSVIHSLQF